MSNQTQSTPLLPETHTILGAGGVIANELMRELVQHVERVRLVRRHPIPPPPRMQAIAANLLDPEQVTSATKGSTVAYLVAGLPYRTNIWEQQWPAIMTNVIKACRRHNVRLVFLDNLYAYGHQPNPITENTPINPCSRKGHVRAQISALLHAEISAGNIQALIARAADFFGPGATKCFTHALVLELLSERKAAVWLGRDDVPHSLLYTPDAGRALALLGTTPEAFGQVWLLPCANPAPTGEQFISHAARLFHVSPSYRVLGPRTLRIAGLFHPALRESLELLYQNVNPYLIDSSKFSKRFFPATPWEEGIRMIEHGMIYPRT